ncbi:MAG TPA: DUF4198 domain-containing protein [Chitinophagaceae bacterium]|nr:DUF4198 domain-containing protein [Chitinophagaceae bacterium]
MPIKKILLAIFLLTFISSLSAHEFWLNPNKFIYKRSEKVNIRFLVGENFVGENWKGNNERIRLLKIYYGGVNDDLSQFITDVEGDSIEYVMLDEGTNLIAFNSNNSFIELAPSKFNEYLVEDGLLNALEYRETNDEMGCNGREFYQRCAKTLLQVGAVKDQTSGINTSMPIDIVPSANPYELKNKALFRAKIFYKGSPLTNALVKIWHRNKKETKIIELRPDANGEIVFPISLSGKWMISTVKMERLFDNPIADWQSYWGSLTWGYE